MSRQTSGPFFPSPLWRGMGVVRSCACADDIRFPRDPPPYPPPQGGRDQIGKGDLPQIQFLEKVVALVVDDDEGGEIDHLDAPDRLHAELGVLEHLDLLDAVLGEPRRRAADRAE